MAASISWRGVPVGEVRRGALLAAEHGLRIATHTWSDAVAITANAHVVAAAPNGITVEVDRTTLPFIDQLLVEPLDIRDGQLQLSGAPGLGIELNFEVVDRYRMADPLDLPLGSYSDMMFGKEHFPQPFEYVEIGDDRLSPA